MKKFLRISLGIVLLCLKTWGAEVDVVVGQKVGTELSTEKETDPQKEAEAAELLALEEEAKAAREKRIQEELERLGVTLDTLTQAQPLISEETEAAATAAVNKKLEGPVYSLAECILIMLRDSEVIQSAYISQIQNQFTLRSAEHEFEPQGTITLGANRQDSYARSGGLSKQWQLTGPSLNLSQKLLTGGTLTFGWSNGGTWSSGNNGSGSGASTNLSLQFSQPLLKGAGLEIGTLPLQRARIAYEQTLINLKSTLIANITKIITDYRAYVSQVENFKIQQEGINRTRRELISSKKKLAAGLLAPYQVTESEAQIASSELTYEQQLDTLDQARITLLRDMNVDTATLMLPDVHLDVDLKYLPTVEECLEIAYQNQPDYLLTLLRVRSAELQLMEAKNNLLWDLRFTAGVSASGSTGASSLQRSNDSAWGLKGRTLSAGLNLTIPVNSITTDQTYLSARIGMRTARIALQQKQEQMRADFQNAIRSIKSQIKQVRTAYNAKELAKRQLAAAVIRFRAGDTTAFEFNIQENNLVSAQQAELSAKITLLNSLTSLDQTLGTTLLTWEIDINPRAAQSPRFRSKFYEQFAPKEQKK